MTPRCWIPGYIEIQPNLLGGAMRPGLQPAIGGYAAIEQEQCAIGLSCDRTGAGMRYRRDVIAPLQQFAKGSRLALPQSVELYAMKTLHLIRHGKSSWADPSLADFDRPLKKRGVSDALLMAPAAAAAGWRADCVYCSGAARARQTIAQWCAVVHQELSSVQYRDELYTFDYRDLMDWLAQQGDNELTIVGHNPALHELIECLSGQLLEKFPTGAYCQLQIDSDSWREIPRGSASILTLLTPRLLKHG